MIASRDSVILIITALVCGPKDPPPFLSDFWGDENEGRRKRRGKNMGRLVVPDVPEKTNNNRGSFRDLIGGEMEGGGWH